MNLGKKDGHENRAYHQEGESNHPEKMGADKRNVGVFTQTHAEEVIAGKKSSERRRKTTRNKPGKIFEESNL